MFVKGPLGLRVQIGEPTGRVCHTVELGKDQDWTKPIIVDVPPLRIPGVTKQDLSVSGAITNSPPSIAWDRLRVEVWDKHSHQVESVAFAVIDKDGRYAVKMAAESELARYKTQPLLWLRVRDIKTNALIAVGNVPLSFNENGVTIQNIQLPQRLPGAPQPFNAQKELGQVRLALSMNDFATLRRFGIKTLKDAANMDCAEIAERTKIDADRLALLWNCTNAIRVHHESLFKKVSSHPWPRWVQEVADSVPEEMYVCPAQEDTWQYRFTEWQGHVTKNETALAYCALAGVAPYWRTHKLRDWLEARREWWRHFKIDRAAPNSH